MYLDILVTGVIRFREEEVWDTFIFQQDGVSFYISNHSLEWLYANYMYLLPWTAKSLDLIPIEKLWGILASQV